MIAVIYKDIMTLKKNALFTVLSCIVAFIYGLYSNNIYAISFSCMLIPLILMIAIFDYDSKSKFCQFAFSTPAKRSDYVIGKLIFSLIFGILGAVSNFIFLLRLGTAIENAIIFSMLTIIGISTSVYFDTFDYKIRYRKGKDNYGSCYKCLDYIKCDIFKRHF